MFCFLKLKQEVTIRLAVLSDWSVSDVVIFRLECFQKSSQKQQQQQADSKRSSLLIAFISTFSDFVDSSEKHRSSSQHQTAASISQEADRGRSSPQWF